MRSAFLLLVSMIIFLAGCGDPPDKPNGQAPDQGNSAPVDTANTGTSTSGSPKSEAVPFTSSNGTVTFMSYKMKGQNQGGFTMITGTINLVNEKPEESSISVEVDMNTLYSDDPTLTEKLKSPASFDVAKFQKGTFKSTKIVAGARPEPNNYTVTGDLEIRGKVNSITFPARIEVTDSDVTVKTGLRLNGEDFGIAKEGKASDNYRDNFAFLFDVKALRQK